MYFHHEFIGRVSMFTSVIECLLYYFLLIHTECASLQWQNTDSACFALTHNSQVNTSIPCLLFPSNELSIFAHPSRKKWKIAENCHFTAEYRVFQIIIVYFTDFDSDAFIIILYFKLSRLPFLYPLIPLSLLFLFVYIDFTLSTL